VNQTVEQQQLMQTRQVILVPQSVLVPYVQTTATGPIRVGGASETQVLNVTSATTQGVLLANGLAANAVGVTGAAATPNANPAAASAAAGAPANPQTLAECVNQLRAAEQRIKQLTEMAETLSTQVERLKANAAATSAPAPNSTVLPPLGQSPNK
jgi:hypothetical protein